MKLRQLFANPYLADPKPIPPRATRRLLVVVISTLMLASIVLSAVASDFVAGLAQVTMIMLLGPVYVVFALWATRNMIFTGKTAALDEWQRDQVVQAQRIAFIIVSSTMLILGLVLANLTGVFHVEFAPVPFKKLAGLLSFAGMYLVPWTPVAVLAWRVPDEDADRPNDTLVTDGGPVN